MPTGEGALSEGPGTADDLLRERTAGQCCCDYVFLWIRIWITSGSEERAPESMESSDQSTEEEKESEKVEEPEKTTE